METEDIAKGQHLWANLGYWGLMEGVVRGKRGKDVIVAFDGLYGRPGEIDTRVLSPRLLHPSKGELLDAMEKRLREKISSTEQEIERIRRMRQEDDALD